MHKYLPRKAADIKGAVALAELRRAHYIIAVLALGFAAVVCFVSLYEVRFNTVLGITAMLLLVFVGFISLATVFALRKR